MTGTKLLEGTQKEGLYEIASTKTSCYAMKGGTTNQNKKNFVKIEWHKRLGHPSDETLCQVMNECNVMLNLIVMNHTSCESCQMGKSHALPFIPSSSHTQNSLDIIYNDFWGPSPINSTYGQRFYIPLMDDYIRYVWLYPLKSKGEAVHAFFFSI